MDDLEQQCEDALFETCDARERYPLLCAEELEKCIKLTNEIYMTKVLTKPIKTLDAPAFTTKESNILERNLLEASDLLKTEEDKLEIMINKVDNLKAALAQIKRDKICEINKLLWN